MLEYLAVGMGGFIGSLLRYLIGKIPLQETMTFPIKTLGINLAGCLLIGLIASLAAREGGMNPKLLLFLKVGLCGGFTTFSTFAIETTGLLQKGRPGLALLYVTLSLLCGLVAVVTGEIMGRR